MSTRYAIEYTKKDGSRSSHAGTIERETDTHVTLAVDVGGFRSFIRANILSMTAIPVIGNDGEKMFTTVFCSCCGGEFHVVRNGGFSNCDDHAGLHNFDGDDDNEWMADRPYNSDKLSAMDDKSFLAHLAKVAGNK
jgi:hypothetical protein